MTYFKEAHRLARSLMVEGLDLQGLKDGLAPFSSVLTSSEKSRLAKLINKEYNILGKAAHDPNFYRNCQEARQAKLESKDPHLKILTYRTPMCSSCEFNRRGNCGLIGGRLFSGPKDVPEIAVQRTADILRSEDVVNSPTLNRIATAKASPAERLATLHAKRQDQDPINPQILVKAQGNSRKFSAILETTEIPNITAKKLIGPRKASNMEGDSLGPFDPETDVVGIDESEKLAHLMEPADMDLEVPSDLPRQTSPMASIQAYDATSFPKFSRVSRELKQEHEILAQKALNSLVSKASELLGRGRVSTRIATTLLERMQVMEMHGARHNEYTSPIRDQLDALSGGLQL